MRLPKLCAMALGVVLTGGSATAQEPEAPISWKGSGEAMFYSAEGEQQIDFDLEFHVDAEGIVSGKTTNEDGSTVLEKFYYGDEVKPQSPALKSRRLVLVYRLQSSDAPWLVILNGTVLGDKYFHGELRMTSANAEGIREALNYGDKTATAMPGNTTLSGLKRALEKSAAMGYFSVKGAIATGN